ncbi:MAG: glycosyltransferase, partial [Proteobacteria bacterium]|nr:glycosyltransferase [Pseudomonadota bacterium]
MPVISVIMPAYNAEKYIADAIDSVLRQTFRDWELIIVNDGSTDKTPGIAKKYAGLDVRIRVIDQKNAGTIAAKNAAASAASGKYLFPLDSDDMIAPVCLERLLKKIKSGKYAVV